MHQHAQRRQHGFEARQFLRRAVARAVVDEDGFVSRGIAAGHRGRDLGDQGRHVLPLVLDRDDQRKRSLACHFAPLPTDAGALYKAASPRNRAAIWARTALELIRRRPLALLFLICLVAWLPGFFTLPPLDRDESRFAQSSKQMVETGNLLDIRFGVEPRYKKPIGIYWAQAATTKAVSTVTGDKALNHMWTYRIPSLIGGLAAVLLAYWCASAFLSAEASFVSALLLGLTLLLASEAKIAKTDAVLLATIVGAQGVLLRAYLARDPGQPAPSLPARDAGLALFVHRHPDQGAGDRRRGRLHRACLGAVGEHMEVEGMGRLRRARFHRAADRVQAMSSRPRSRPRRCSPSPCSMATGAGSAASGRCAGCC